MLTYANIPTGKINVTPLITHRYKLADIAEATTCSRTSWMA